jgi:hypothetical protein
VIADSISTREFNLPNLEMRDAPARFGPARRAVRYG